MGFQQQNPIPSLKHPNYNFNFRPKLWKLLVTIPIVLSSRIKIIKNPPLCLLWTCWSAPFLELQVRKEEWWMTEQEMKEAEEILELELEEVLKDTDHRINKDFHLIILHNTIPLSYIHIFLRLIWAYLPPPMGITFPITTTNHSNPLKLNTRTLTTMLTLSIRLNRAITTLVLSQPLQLHSSQSSLTPRIPLSFLKLSLTSSIKETITLILGAQQ